MLLHVSGWRRREAGQSTTARRQLALKRQLHHLVVCGCQLLVLVVLMGWWWQSGSAEHGQQARVQGSLGIHTGQVDQQFGIKAGLAHNLRIDAQLGKYLVLKGGGLLLVLQLLVLMLMQLLIGSLAVEKSSW